jgi:hypothetical protein
MTFVLYFFFQETNKIVHLFTFSTFYYYLHSFVYSQRKRKVLKLLVLFKLPIVSNL